MPTFEFTAPDGKTYSVAGPDGSTKEQAFQMLQAQLGGTPAKQEAPAEPFGQRLNREISDIPRQVGLTARHGIEGVGDTLEFLSSPIRGALNAALPASMQINPGAGRYVADTLGLPKTQNSTERVVGDAARMMAGSALPMLGAGKLAEGVQGIPKTVLQGMASNPGAQVTSAAAAGGAGGYTRETGGNDASQLAASLAAGIAAPMALNKVQQVGMSAANAVRNRINPAPVSAQIDITINNALKDSGMTMADLPSNVQAGIRNDVQQALKMNGALSPDAIRRLADYRLTNTTPTAATLTLDPAMVSQQQNLAKLGINSKDPAAQQLGRVQNANNQQLVAGLNDLGASTADDAVAGGQKIASALLGRDAQARANIGAAYASARATDGRSMPLDPAAFTTTADDMLGYNLVRSKVPADVRAMMNSVAKGDMPLTVDTAEEIKTRLGDLQRISTNGGEIKALGLVRRALDQTPLLNDGAGFGQESINAFNVARGLNKSWMDIVDSTPALKAVRDGIEPDKFVQQFVIGTGAKANSMDVARLKNLISGNDDAMGAVRNQITAYLKKAALNGANDEVGNFSQSNYNKALNAIGDRKLQLFFQPDDLNQLKAIGRVASYEQFQPKGSAVNNSNTASTAMAAILDRIGNSPLLSKIPLGNYISGPAQNISVGMQANRAMSVPRGLLSAEGPGAMPPAGLLMSPAAFMQQDDERRKRGLLFP